MIDSKTLKKIRQEEPLDAQEEALLDATLSADSQRMAASFVKSMPSEEPSLAWRANLNEKLREMAPAQEEPAVRRRKLPAWTLGFAMAGVAAAAALIALLMVPPIEPTSGSTAQAGLEEAMVKAHDDQVSLGEIGLHAPVFEQPNKPQGKL